MVLARPRRLVGHATRKTTKLVDPDNESRVLVTTRVAGLLKNAVEVDLNVLDRDESRTLLISSAGMDEAEITKGSDEYRIIDQIVECCGCLPLALTIVGAMVADSHQGFTEDILEVMEYMEHEIEDEQGVPVAERVIANSEKMMIRNAGKGE